MKRNTQSYIRWVLLNCLLMLGGGCQTMGQPRRDMGAQMREDVLLAQEESHRLSGRILGVEEELALFRRQLRDAHDERARTIRQELDPLQQRTAALERRLDALEAARLQDRGEIIAVLSKQMAEEFARRFVPSTRSDNSARRSIPSDGYGYEHSVQAGETLSAIAAVYKVSSKAIIDANNLKNPDRLQTGQVLFIPE